MARHHGPSGYKRVRRYRLAMETKGDVVVVRRKNSRPMPGNWREVLAEFVPAAAADRAQEERDRKGRLAWPSAFVPVEVMIPKPQGANKPWSMAFGIPRAAAGSSEYRRMFAQRMAVDRAIEVIDVGHIPVIGQPKVFMKNGQMYVKTELRANRQPSHFGLSTFDVNKLKGIPGLDRRHIKVYTARGGLLGLHTACPSVSTCDCKNILPQVWEKAWQM